MHFLAFSIDPARNGDPALGARAARARALLAHAAGDDALLLGTTGALPLARAGEASVADRCAPAFEERTRRPLDAPALARALADDAGAAALSLAAPAAVAALAGGAVRAVCDRAGQGHLHLHQGDGFAALSSSAGLLAALVDAPADKDAFAGLALTGSMIGEETAWRGVALAPFGRWLKLAAGRVEPLPFDATAMHAPAGIGAPLRDAVAALSDAFPHAGIDLSGGWDTRLMLAALPADRRARHPALTLGRADAPDVLVARRIARAFGLQHRILDPLDIAAVEPDALWNALVDVARLDEHALNPLDRALFHLLNLRDRAQPPRFNGQNGEIVRGFYYPRQPLDAAPSRALAESLVDWRLSANERADPALFRPGWWGDARAAARRRLADRALAMPGATWGEALDAFYLQERMRRWNGRAASTAMGYRRLLTPFFADAFLRWAMAQPVAAKTAARMPAALIRALEPALMRVPLDSGLTPDMVLRGGPEAALRKLRLTGGKALRKVAQRLGARAAPTLGSGAVAQAFARHGLHRRLDLHAIDALGMVAPDRLDAIGAGRWTPDPATLGFVATLHALTATR